MVALVASLGSGLYYLMVDQGDKNSRRTFHSLGVRLTLAIMLATLLVYGVATGQLGHRNPWDPGPRGSSESTESREASQREQTPRANTD